MSSVTIPHTLEASHPAEVVRWAAKQYGVEGLVVTASFEDAVLVHVSAMAVPGIEIVLLDTQYLFAETEWFAEQLRQRLDLNLRVVHPLATVLPDNLWQTDTAACCNARKVEPLQRAIAGRSAWLTGVRRVDGPTRATTPVAAYDVGRGLVKVNPLATFTDDDMALYEQLYELPRNPLTDRGYPSIGCWPCTRPVAPGEDKRAGRWAGSEKTECGLHA
jgi:phosphoadenosine phosphosulfate reductase